MFGFLQKISGAEQLRHEKARLEAFLAAFPGEYCGWSREGSIAYSQGFCKILGLDHIRQFADIQNALSLSDGAALESVFNRLKSDAIPFTITAKNSSENKTLKISGSKGADLEGQDYFFVLWLEDITREIRASEHHKQEEDKKYSKLETLKNAFRAMPYPAWIRGDDHRIIWCNEPYAALFDIIVDEVIKDQREITSASKKKRDNEAILGPDLAKKAQKKGEAVSTETHIIQGGKRYLFEITELPVSGQKGTFGMAENISEREELQGALTRYEATNKELLEQLSTAIGIYGQDQKLEFYNSAFSELWGVEGGWLNTKPKLGEIMEKLRENRQLPEQADFRAFKKSWLDMFTSLIDPHEDMLYLPGGEALRMLVVPQNSGGLMMTFEDVTSRLELESSYNTLIAVQKETLDNLGEAVAVFGGDGRLKLWNPAYGRLWDLNPELLDGEPHISKIVQKLEKFFTEENWPEQKTELTSMALDRVMHEGRIKRADSTHIDYTTVPLPDGGVLATFSDITDTVQVEEALRDKNEALEAADKLKLDFLANVSYQLRTPLNAIIGFNEILDQEYFGKLNERQKEYTYDIKEASKRLLGLIDDILDLSSIEAGYMKLEKKPIKIYDMLKNIYELMHEWVGKEKLELKFECPKNIGTYTADERRLKQAILNLLRNSINFTPSGGKITISASNKKDGLYIIISDTGIGISRDQQLRIFEPFERANTGDEGKKDTDGKASPFSPLPQKNRGGAGLGLSLVKNIITLHNGDIELSSKLGEGTNVIIKLPKKD